MVHRVCYTLIANKTKGDFIMTYTWKIVYFLPGNQWSGGNIRGVALIEAESRQDASFAFQRQYAGQFSTIEKIEKLG